MAKNQFEKRIYFIRNWWVTIGNVVYFYILEKRDAGLKA
jgi:hypothetical protein